MPKVLYNTEADWLGIYRIRIRDISHPLNGQTVGYGRVWAQRSTGPYDDDLTEFNNRVANLVRLFSIQTTDRILVQGCGLGFLIEAFKDAGFLECFGLDNSSYISSIRAVEANANSVIVEQDIRGGGLMRAQLQTQTGGNSFTWVITESVLESYEDLELSELLDDAESVLNPTKDEANIIHMVMSVKDPAQPDRSIGPQFNQKTLAEWKAVRPAHSWVDYVRWEVG